MDPTETPVPVLPPADVPAATVSADAVPVAVEAPEPVTVEPAAAAVSSPVAPMPAGEPATAPVADKPGEHAKRILLVEDDDSLANVYVTRLQAEGFDVRRVGNGEDALAAALNYKPNLVLLDVMMPRVSGFDVLDIMRNTPETANLKVIMLTALSQDSDVTRAKELGADEYLIKSQVVIADVIERIRHQLGEK